MQSSNDKKIEAIASRLSIQMERDFTNIKKDEDKISFEMSELTQTGYQYRTRYTAPTPEEIKLNAERANQDIVGDARSRYPDFNARKMLNILRDKLDALHKELPAVTIQHVKRYAKDGENIVEGFRLIVPIDKLDSLLDHFNAHSKEAKKEASGQAVDQKDSAPPSYDAALGDPDSAPPSYDAALGDPAIKSEEKKKDTSSLFSSPQPKNEALEVAELLKKLVNDKKDENIHITGYEIVGDKIAIRTLEDSDKKAKTREAVGKILPVENVQGEYYFFVTIKDLINSKQKLEEVGFQSKQRKRYLPRK